MLSMNKLLKKLCVLGVSAVTTLSFCSPFVKGAAPTTSDKGVLVGPVNIAKNTTDTDAPYATITLASGLTFTGSPQQLISSVDSVTMGIGGPSLQFASGTGQQVKVYLRVADSKTANASTGDWIEYTGTSSLSNAKLMRTLATGSADGESGPSTGDKSDYYVFYYIDGMNNVLDNGKGTSGSIETA